MPWNCLCSKEKKRPHISAPILDPNNEDENQKLMPIIKSPKNHHNHHIMKATTTISKQNIEKFETKLKVENEKLNKKSKKEKSNLLKQQQKETIKIINQNENLSSSSSSPVVSVIEQQSETKINRQLVNVKFSFDNEKLLDGNSEIIITDDDKNNNNSSGKIKSSDKLVLEKIDENLDENENDNGNYDILPLISVEEVREQTRLQDIENGNNQKAVAHVITIDEGDGFTHSTESIPYIDDEQQTKVNFHDDKFITVTAKNTTRSDYTKTKLFDKSVQLLYQIVNQTENETKNILYQIMHDFIVYENFDQAAGKLCQICHHCLRKPLVTIRCKSCNFTCHQYCVDVKNFDGNQTIPKSQTFPASSANNHLQAIHQHQQPVSPTTKLSDSLRLSYVTERILSSILPKRTADEQQSFIEDGTNYEDKYEREIIEMLEQKHGKNYRLFDLESCIQTITLEKLCELCKHIDSWLGSGREKVVVLQDRGDRQRLGTAIAAYLEYQKICGSNFPRSKSFDDRGGQQGTLSRNCLNLDVFSMQKFLEDVAGPLRVPSHKRYLQYFSGLLSGNIKMNSSPLFLKYVSIESPPSWMSYNSLNTQSSEWKSFLKIYEGLHCVFTTDIHVVPISTRQFIYEIGNLRLRGDVTVRCYQILLNSNGYSTDQRELMFSVQFHTCAVTERNISFGRADLDYACDDPRFPNDHKLLLNFDGFNESGGNRNLYIQSPLIRIEPGNTVVTRWDSFEHLNEGSSHTQGPLDGSLYATISKSPKSPQPSPKNNFLNGLASTTVTTTTATTPAKPLRGSTQNLISPPPEFRNHQQIQQQQQQIQNQSDFILENNRYQRSVSVPVNHNNINNSSSSSNNHNNLNSASSINQLTKINSIKRNPSSVTTYQTTQQYSPQTNTNQIRIVETTTTSVVENSNNNGQQPRNTVGVQQYPASNDGREASVRSPLTLSMDSGISSSCIVNRRTQGSSVSPSSFPSQASPQEDRHRELDDILTDMLMTVQDIPDYSNSTSPNAISKSHSLSKVQQSTTTKLVPISSSISSSVLASSQQNIANTNTIKRSQSYNTNNNNNNNNNNKIAIQQTATNTIESNQISEGERYNIERDIYDTSSTTTTLTPPPSESGRETPVINYRDKLNENHIIMEQHQSYTYTQPGRNDILISEENIHNHNNQNNNTIPYHAREDSRPFSYGNIPTSPQQLQQSQSSSGIMLKMQSGLSSPSLVRKHLGINPNSGNSSSTSTLTRKTPPRNDFEEMLRERREKVLSEKYSISDNNNHSGLNSANNHNKLYQSDSVNNNNINNNNNNNNKQWYNTMQSSSTVTTNSKAPIQQSNGYHHYHEPLKRSNTMDGGFGRQYSYSTSSSTTSDGVSGPTWLQLQQQKLRAKKEQQHHDDYRPNHYEQRVVRTEIINNHNSRPLRSRSNASRYNDGYVSDTAAFGNDEVDYRRPLHVQTPHGQSVTLNRSNSSLGTHGGPERNYNTIQTTTITTTSKERPFVAVKRAHEQAKQHGYNESDITPPTITKSTSSTANDNEACMNVINNNTINCNNNNHDHSINNNHNNNNSNVNDDKVTSGQLALDKLLASLTQKRDYECQISNKNTNNNNINRPNQSPTTLFSSQLSTTSSSSSPISSLSSYSPTNGAFLLNNQTVNANNNISNKKEDLTDVITNLTEYNNNNITSVKKRNDSASISPSLSERSNGAISWNEKVREESFSSYRSENEQDLSPSMSGSRPETPAFPVTPRTPLFGIGNSSPALPPKSPTSQRRHYNSTWSLRSQKSAMSSYDLSKDLYSGNQTDTSNYTSRRNSTTSNANSEPQEVAAHHVKFVRDSSKYWYKPHLTRDEAVNLLRNAAPGTFIVRDSTTFLNAFGLVIRVSHPPPGVQPKGPPGDELVRHFLIEPTTRGVRLKGCANEPVFTSLSALVYQHSITQLALPCKLMIPDRDVDSQMDYVSPTQQQILDQGAACNVLYLFTCDTESLTGPQAVRKGVSLLFSRRPLPTPTTVHFKVSRQGITLTDNTRRLFFRKHHPANNITFIGLDPDAHTWSVASGGDIPVSSYKIFAFIAKRSPSSADNQCHVFCELDPRQPATAIVNYAYKAIPNSEHSVAIRSI